MLVRIKKLRLCPIVNVRSLIPLSPYKDVMFVYNRLAAQNQMPRRHWSSDI